MNRPARASLISLAALVIAAPQALAQPGAGNPKFVQPAEKTKSPQRDAKKEVRPDDGEKPTTAAKIDLRPRFVAGQTVRFSVDSRNLTRLLSSKPAAPARGKPPSPTTPGGSAPDAGTQTSQSFVLRMTTKEVTDDGATIDVTFESLKMKIDGPDYSIDFDSTKPAKPDEPEDALIRSLVGTAITLRADKDGNITSAGGGDSFMALLTQLGGGGGAGQPAMPGSPGSGMIGSILNAKKGSGLVSVGERWSNIDTLRGGFPGSLSMLTEHALESMSGRVANVSIRGRIEGEKSPGGAPAPVQVKDADIRGNYTWDTESGMLQNLDFHNNFTEEHDDNGARTSTRNESSTAIKRLKADAPARPK